LGRLELGTASVAFAATLLLAAHSPAAPAKPKVEGFRCVERCAGVHAMATRGELLIGGRGLAATSAVVFAGAAGPVSAAPASAEARRVRVIVPAEAISGPVALERASGERGTTRQALEIVPSEELPPDDAFRLRRTSVKPKEAFVDGRREPRVRFRFEATGRRDLRIEVVRNGGVVRRFDRAGLAPFARHTLRWNGLTEDGDAARESRYTFRVGPAGDTRKAGGFRLRDHRFPIRGGHRYGDRFGEPRSGGRVHQGQDLWAGCGTRLEAARGGHVQVRAYSGALYGHYVVVDGFKTDRDYMYAHMTSNVRAHDGERVFTGETIGFVGDTGNARSEGCQLHFELWPNGFRNGGPANPRGELRRWDRYS
jgi:murein DD-endopeptidase MepM/ murein hydrolase activator NlpD